MPFDPTWPPHEAELLSEPFRNQFNSLKALIDAQAAQLAALENRLLPIGCIAGWCKDLGPVPPLPGTWVECNGEVLNDPASPLNGITLPDLNVTQRFLRGAITSGNTGGAETHAHGFGGAEGASAGTDVMFPQNEYPGTTADSHLPPYYEVVYVMRVK